MPTVPDLGRAPGRQRLESQELAHGHVRTIDRRVGHLSAPADN
jgi:hypothetical protein